MTTRRMPNFLIIGTAKASTTSLYHYLKQHPDVFMPSKKEMHFFSSLPSDAGTYVADPPRSPADPHRHILTLSEYQRFFDGVRHERAIGEASPTYIYYTASAQHIREAIPDAKIVAVLRNPADRAFSAWMHLVRDGVEDLAFEAALEQESDRIRQGIASFYHYKAWGYYYPQLKRYFDLFDPSQIRVYLQEDVDRRADEVVKDLFQFLGVDDRFQPDTKVRHNVSGVPKNRRLHQFLTEGIHTSPVWNVLKRPIPERTYRRWITGVKNRNLVKPAFNPSTRRKLLDEYRVDIRECQTILGRDLGHWLA
jgi:hypothetical protein